MFPDRVNPNPNPLREQRGTSDPFSKKCGEHWDDPDVGQAHSPSDSLLFDLNASNVRLILSHPGQSPVHLETPGPKTSRLVFDSSPKIDAYVPFILPRVNFKYISQIYVPSALISMWLWYTCKGASVAALAVKCSQTSSNLHQNINQKHKYLQIPRPGIIKLKCAFTSSQMGEKNGNNWRCIWVSVGSCKIDKLAVVQPFGRKATLDAGSLVDWWLLVLAQLGLGINTVSLIWNEMKQQRNPNRILNRPEFLAGKLSGWGLQCVRDVQPPLLNIQQRVVGHTWLAGRGTAQSAFTH